MYKARKERTERSKEGIKTGEKERRKKCYKEDFYESPRNVFPCLFFTLNLFLQYRFPFHPTRILFICYLRYGSAILLILLYPIYFTISCKYFLYSLSPASIYLFYESFTDCEKDLTTSHKVLSFFFSFLFLNIRSRKDVRFFFGRLVLFVLTMTRTPTSLYFSCST